MSLPVQTLSAIQVAGNAVFEADASLKQSIQTYAEQVKTAMLQNPFDLGNDSLFEDWKTVARLSQAMTQIEVELRKIYAAASELSKGGHPALTVTPALAAPAPPIAEEVQLVTEINATDVAVKKAPRRLKKKAKRKTASSTTIKGNTLKVLARMVEVLNPNDFVKVNQSAEATAIGLPKGSIGASIAKLVATGHLLSGPAGTFKLAAPKSE